MSDHNLPQDANANQGADQGAQPTQAPQPPTPVPSVRLSIHTRTPPTPARRTSLTALILVHTRSDHLSHLEDLDPQRYQILKHDANQT